MRLIDADKAVESICTKADENNDPWIRNILYAVACYLDTLPTAEIEHMNLYDEVEEHPNCTVQILTNSTTGEVSVGWWENAEEV